MNKRPQEHLDQPDEILSISKFNEFVTEHPSVIHIYDKAYEAHDAYTAFINNIVNSKGDRGVRVPPLAAEIDGYLGSGVDKSSFALDEDFVVKVQHPRIREGDEGRKYFSLQIDDLVRGHGIEGLEQLVAADQEKGILITTRAKGQLVSEIPSGKLMRSISSKHISKLEQTLQDMTDNLLSFDNVNNVLFDPKEGFTIVDYKTPSFLSAGEKYSMDESDENYSPFYEEFIATQQIDSVLNRLLSSRKKSLDGHINTLGDTEHYMKPTIGRRVVRTLVNLKQKK